MNYNSRLINALCASTFIIGLVTTLSWSYSSRWFGLFLLFSSILVVYFINIRNVNTKDQEILNQSKHMNPKQASLGLLLVVVDILYNLITKGNFRYFDYGVISAGLIIVLINTNFAKFLRLDTQKVAFSTYFVFFTIVLYGFLFKGLDIILGTSGDLGNPFWNWFGVIVVRSVVPFLSIIKPTISNGTTIDFSGFAVSVGYACSGIESISVFFSAVIAYFISIKEYNYVGIIKYLLIGSIILFLVNLLRIFIIVITGYYLGVNTMMFVHVHLGWILFVLSMTVFWYLLFNERSNTVANTD